MRKSNVTEDAGEQVLETLVCREGSSKLCQSACHWNPAYHASDTLSDHQTKPRQSPLQHMERQAILEDEHALRATLPTVERSLGYQFHDRRLLLTALTHRSFCHETNTASGDFDELEWLGDSVLQLAISSWLFRSAKGSKRSSGQLSKTRQRFVDAGACESFAMKLNLFPHLRTGQGQPVRGTKILADCFEAVLGAVYVDAGGCSDLEPIHGILARVIPSYEREHGRRPPQNFHPSEHHHHRHHHHPHHNIADAHAPPESPRPRAKEATKLMNLAHRITQMARQGMTANQSGDLESNGAARGQVSSPPRMSAQPSPQEVVREFDERLRSFERNSLRRGSLSYATSAFVEDFGAGVANFFQDAASDPDKSGLLDDVLAGSSMLRKHFVDAPPGAERVVMEVVLVSSEVRLQYFSAVEHLMINVLRQGGDRERSALRLIRSAPDGGATVALLSNLIVDSATSLLFSSRQRAALSPAQPPSHTHVPIPSPASQPPPPVTEVHAALRPEIPQPLVSFYSNGDFGPDRGRGSHPQCPPWGGPTGAHPRGRGWSGPDRGRARRHGGRRGGCR